MATTEIHAIKTTPNKALDYALADKVLACNSEEEINKEVTYRISERNGQKYITYTTLNSFQNCNPIDPYSTFRDTQNKWQNVKYMNSGGKVKDKQEPVIWHLHQSFKGMEATPEIANEIGRKLAEEVFKDFSVTISTHCNTDNIHNHLMICAWNSEGKKWNDCHKTKRLIRSVSDRLCEEYGLSVLDHTKGMKLISYQDKNGAVHYYEPTDRKNKLITKRENREITTDDVSSYRNTLIFEEKQRRKNDCRAEIKADIDAVLPSCRTYEELLERLRELGYKIRDKKKNGDWLAHISFQSPTQDKAVREDKIGDGKFYLREQLEKYIAEQVKYEKERSVNDDEKVQKTVKYFSEYKYGITNIEEIDDNYKTVLENGEYKTQKRTSTERKVLADIRIKDKEVRGLIDTTVLHKLIEQQEKQMIKKSNMQKKREQVLVEQIQSSFRCLQYTEQHHIYSYRQIIDLYKANKAKYDATIDNFNKAESAIQQLKDILELPQKVSAILNKMESGKNDVSYIVEHYNDDKRTLDKYKSIMKKFKIDTEQGYQLLESKIAQFESKQSVNRSYMSKVILQMSELENCIRTFDRIDCEHGNRHESEMNEFERIIKSQNQQKRTKKEMEK